MASDIYPAEIPDSKSATGLFPVDFVIETVIRAGLKVFKEDPDLPGIVFGQLKAPYLSDKYGQSKIDEITAYIKSTDIKIVQHWSLIDQQYPCFSIQLLDGSEREDRASLDDNAGDVDAIDDATDAVLGRQQVGYVAISDNVHIGIHAGDTPDLTKYLYYLLIYILSAFKPQLQERGIQLSTFRATDISRMNDYLPNNLYSRFVNFSVYTQACFIKGDLPILEEILGVHFRGEDDGAVDEINGGVTVANIQQSDGE